MTDAPRPDGLALIAYPLRLDWAAPIVPAPTTREWMVGTHKSFANRCLPLLMANQSGWHIVNLDPFRATYHGGDRADAIRIESLREDGAPPAMVTSQFGYGVLTWQVPYLFRTPPGYNLLVRGPANMPRDGIGALEGLVETDWATQSFTMNWKFTRPGAEVTFGRGDPFCMLVPQRRHELEAFEPSLARIEGDPEAQRRHATFVLMREREAGMRRAAQLVSGFGAAFEYPFQRHYFEGKHATGEPSPEHQQRRALRPFRIPPDPDPEPPATAEPADGGGRSE